MTTKHQPLTNFLNFLFCINAVDFEHLGNMLMLLLVGDFSGCFIRVLALPTIISTGTIMNSPSRFAGSKIQPKKEVFTFLPAIFLMNYLPIIWSAANLAFTNDNAHAVPVNNGIPVELLGLGSKMYINRFPSSCFCSHIATVKCSVIKIPWVFSSKKCSIPKKKIFCEHQT